MACARVHCFLQLSPVLREPCCSAIGAVSSTRCAIRCCGGAVFCGGLGWLEQARCYRCGKLPQPVGRRNRHRQKHPELIVNHCAAAAETADEDTERRAAAAAAAKRETMLARRREKEELEDLVPKVPPQPAHLVSKTVNTPTGNVVIVSSSW